MKHLVIGLLIALLPLSASAVYIVDQGGTGAQTFPAGSILTGNNKGAITATSAPTVDYITATSTTASSSFGNGINLKSGCFSINGTCFTGVVTSVFGRIGAVVATAGDYTTSLVTESATNLYFTVARAIAALIGQDVQVKTLTATSSITSPLVTAGSGTFGALTATTSLVANSGLIGSTTVGSLTATGTITANAVTGTSWTGTGRVTAPNALIGSTTFGTITATGTITANTVNLTTLNGTTGAFTGRVSGTGFDGSATSSLIGLTASSSYLGNINNVGGYLQTGFATCNGTQFVQYNASTGAWACGTPAAAINTGSLTIGALTATTSFVSNSALVGSSTFGTLTATGTITANVVNGTKFVGSATSSLAGLTASSSYLDNLLVAGALYQTGLSDCTGSNFLQYTLSTGKFSCGTPVGGGGGGGGGAWATNTANTLTYLGTQWTALIGGTATTTNARLEVVGTLAAGTLVATDTGTSTMAGGFSIGGSVFSTYFAATSTATSSFPYASSTGISTNWLCLNGNCNSSWPAGTINTGALTIGALTATTSFIANSALIGSTTVGTLTATGTVTGNASNWTTLTATASSTIANLTIGTFATATQLSIARGFFQDGLTDCSSESQTLLYTLSSGKFSCGTDAGAGAGTPGGSNGQIQMNVAGAFGGNDGLTWDYLTTPSYPRLGIGSSTPWAKLSVVATSTNPGDMLFAFATSSGDKLFNWIMNPATTTVSGVIQGINYPMNGTTTLRDNVYLGGRVSLTDWSIDCGYIAIVAAVTLDSGIACGVNYGWSIDVTTDMTLTPTVGGFFIAGDANGPIYTISTMSPASPISGDSGAIRTPVNLFTATNTITMEAVVSLPSATSSTWRTRIGISNAPWNTNYSTSEPIGAYFEASSTLNNNWYAVVRGGTGLVFYKNTGVATTTLGSAYINSTTRSLATPQPQKFRVELSTAGVLFFINDTLVSQYAGSVLSGSPNIVPMAPMIMYGATASTPTRNLTIYNGPRVWGNKNYQYAP